MNTWMEKSDEQRIFPWEHVFHEFRDSSRYQIKVETMNMWRKDFNRTRSKFSRKLTDSAGIPLKSGQWIFGGKISIWKRSCHECKFSRKLTNSARKLNKDRTIGFLRKTRFTMTASFRGSWQIQLDNLIRTVLGSYLEGVLIRTEQLGS